MRVAGPTGTRTEVAVDRCGLGEHVWDATHIEVARQRLKIILVLQNQSELAHEPWVFEILLQSRIELSHEQGIVVRQRGNEGRIDGHVIFCPVAGAAGAAVAVEGFVKGALVRWAPPPDWGKTADPAKG